MFIRLYDELTEEKRRADPRHAEPGLSISSWPIPSCAAPSRRGPPRPPTSTRPRRAPPAAPARYDGALYDRVSAFMKRIMEPPVFVAGLPIGADRPGYRLCKSSGFAPLYRGQTPPAAEDAPVPEL